MLTIVLTNNRDIEDKLKSILDTAEVQGETGIVIMTDNTHDVLQFFKKKKAIKELKVSNETFYIIKHMRVQIKQIDYFI